MTFSEISKPQTLPPKHPNTKNSKSHVKRPNCNSLENKLVRIEKY